MTPNDVTEMFRQLMEGVHTVLPATITAVQSDRRVTVLPSIGHQLFNGQSMDIPELEDVPILFLGTTEAVIELPLSVGDSVLLLIIGPDARTWLTQQWLPNQIVPASPVRHSLMSCLALPVMRDQHPAKTRISISNDGTITLTPKSGKCNIMADLFVGGKVICSELAADADVVAGAKSVPIGVLNHLHSVPAGPGISGPAQAGGV